MVTIKYKLSDFFNVFLIKLFALEFFLLSFIFLGFTTVNQKNNFKDIIITDQDLLTQIIISQRANNLMARDLILYRYAEENNLINLEFKKKIDLQSLDKCEDKENNIKFCKLNKNTSTIFQRITSDDLEIGYLRITFIQKDNSYNRNILLIALVLIINLVLSIIGFNRIARGPLQRDLKKLIASIKENNLKNKIHYTIEEYEYISRTFNSLVRKIKASEIHKQRLEYQNQKVALARQVAHDIRSPIAALEVIQDDLSILPSGTKEIVLTAINRVNEISNNLSIEYKENILKKEVAIEVLLKEIITEKRLKCKRLNKSIQIKLSSNIKGFSFLKIMELDFYRVFSNLLNNSIESIEKEGLIKIEIINNSQGKLTLTISDSGLGFPEEILKNPFEKNLSIGKKGGSGLGLHYAQSTVESHNGTIKIFNSKQGANIEISLPLCAPPSWYVNELNLKSYKKIYIIDDDKNMHQYWSTKLGIKDLEVFYFFEPIDLSIPQDDTLIIIDFDLKESMDGIDLIKKFNLNHFILVTSNFDHPKVENFFANKKDSKMIPKQFLYKLIIKN